MVKRVRIKPSIEEQALIRLMRTGDRMWRASDEHFSKWGMTDNHYNVLRILNGAGEPISQSEIGRRMLSSRANVTKLVDLLEGRGYVKRLACGDRRVNLVALTQDGAGFLETSLEDVQKHASRSLEPLSRDEIKTLFRLLGKLSGES